ncbi:MAG: hypothetical protein WBN92_11200 [Terriglobia bacterium]
MSPNWTIVQELNSYPPALAKVQLSRRHERIDRSFRENAECQRTAAVEGIGPVTAPAVVAAISDARAFQRPRRIGT